MRVLHAAVTGGGQIGIALVLLAREGLRRGVDLDRRLCRRDHGLLDVELCPLACDRSLRRGDIGLGLVQCYLEIAVVDPCQYLAGRDALVVPHQDFAEIAGDFWRDRRVVGLHISVVGRDQITADGPVVPAVPGHAGQERHRGAGHQDAPDRSVARDRCSWKRGGYGRLILGVRPWH